MTSSNQSEGSAPTSPSTCPNCKAPVRTGEMVCSKCNYSLVGSAISSATRSIGRADESFETTRPKIGSALRKTQKVGLIIGDKEALLPAARTLIIGRGDPRADTPPPDVDLAPYGAEDKGVSRHHIELTWKNDLIYVSDMGSTNGTLLNGQRLMTGIERILRDQDQLVIGQLQVTVHLLDA